MTEGSYTRDEWCNLLRLFDIMFFFFLAAISVSRGNPQLHSGSVKGAAGNCERDGVHGAAGNYRQDIVQNRVQKPETFLKFGKQTTILEGVAGNCSGALPRAACLTVQGVAGNCNERVKSNSGPPQLASHRLWVR